MLPHMHLLDLSGPAQAFYEANELGGDYSLSFVGPQPMARTAQGLCMAEIEPLGEIHAGDLIVIPGIDSRTLDRIELGRLLPWLRGAGEAGATLCSICSGAWVLAMAGLLDGRNCTTHWRIVERMQRAFPAINVLTNRLFVRDGSIVTSAGIASGIDMALWLVEQDNGPLMAARVAREMVVYLRREGHHSTESIYLDYRAHLHPGVHRVQDWLIANPDQRTTIDNLADIAGMSPRNLTRVFRQATGVTLKDFSTRIKLELAKALLHSPELTVESVAAKCGFKDSRQLRRLWRQHFGRSPSSWRELSPAPAQ